MASSQRRRVIGYTPRQTERQIRSKRRGCEEDAHRVRSPTRRTELGFIRRYAPT
jgi:hypothetical protein